MHKNFKQILGQIGYFLHFWYHGAYFFDTLGIAGILIDIAMNIMLGIGVKLGYFIFYVKYWYALYDYIVGFMVQLNYVKLCVEF